MKQIVADYTGEGAYHGSTKPKPQKLMNPFGVKETEATTFAKYRNRRAGVFDTFNATLSRVYREVAQLPVPSQEDIKNDGSTFVWKPFDEALEEAGPLTKSVLKKMQKHLIGQKKYCYVDSKIQYFEPGDVPVDSRHYHLDGTIVIRGKFAEQLGYPLLHDMRARICGESKPPTYLSYQSSTHCPTHFVTEPLSIRVPDFIPNFDEFSETVLASSPTIKPQPAASIVATDGLSLHSAVSASEPGWRLWIRVMETDRLVVVNSEVSDCYLSTYRTKPVKN